MNSPDMHIKTNTHKYRTGDKYLILLYSEAGSLYMDTSQGM